MAAFNAVEPVATLCFVRVLSEINSATLAICSDPGNLKSTDKGEDFPFGVSEISLFPDAAIVPSRYKVNDPDDAIVQIANNKVLVFTNNYHLWLTDYLLITSLFFTPNQ